jgi:gliding motility-associated-like protein
MDAQHFTLTGITATYGLALADMNGDGKPDVVVSDNATNSKIAYLENTSVSGAITFASSVTLYSAMAVAYPQLEIADIDGDNKPDIIAANNTNGIVVFRNRAAEAGKISADQTICSGVTPSSLTSLTPATFPTGGTITYKWQSSTNGTSWTDITSSNTLGYTIPSGLTVTTYYRRAATNATTYYFTNPIVITVTPNPTITANVPATACGTSTVTLSATSSGGVVKWYSASTGGTLLGTGSSLITPSIATTTTYYAQAESANGCISSAARTAVAATIVTTAPVIQSTTTAARCDSGSVTLTATLSAATTYGATLNWYATATGGTAVGTGTSFVTPSMSATTIYYVEATNCNGTSARTSVTASVINTPSIVNTLPNAGCRNTNVVLSATSTSGSSLNWYSVASAGSAAVGNATVYSITANTTRYVAAYITSAGITCESPRTEVVATMYNLPAAATAVNTTLCGLGTATVSVTTASNTSIKWYDTANAGTLLGTGLSYVTPVIAANTSYFAAVTDANGCNATTRTKVDVVYNGPTVSILNNLNAITNTTNNTITATIANQTSYIWQRSIDGGTNWTDITANLDPNVTYSGFSGTTGTTTTLTISKAIPFMHLYKYRLKVTKSVGCDNYSNVATLNVADIFGSCDYSPFASPVNQSYSNRENTWVHYEYDGYGGNYNYFERHGYDSSLGSLNDNNQNSGLIVVPNSTDYSYITIDLGTSKVIDKAYLQGFKTWSPSGSYYSSNYPETYYDIYYDPYETYYGGEMNSENADGADILVSNDQVNWTTVYSDIQGTFYDSFNNQSGYTTVSFPPISARYVKVARNTWGYLGLSEFQVFPVDTGNAPYIRFAPQAVNYVSTGSTFPINVDVTANGNSTLSYQWKKSNDNVSFTNLTNSGTISGVTTNKLGISSFAAGNIGYYKLDVNQSNWCYVSTTVETRLVAPYYTSAAGATAMQTLSSWNTNSTGTGGSAPANFTTATNVFILSNSANSTYNAGTNYSNAGNLRLNGNKFTLGNYNATWGSVLESSATAYVKTNGSGQLINTNTSTTPVIFPVGNSSYNPLTITNNTGTTDTFAVSVSDGVWDGGTNGNGTAMNNVINRTWKVTKTTANSGGYGVDLTFGWTASDISGLVVDPILYAFVPGTGWVAQSVGSISRTATTVTFTKYTGALNSTLFMLSNAAPVITSFSPVNTGTGNSVVIKGTGLSNTSTVSFGGVAATSYVVNSATQITAVVGLGASGSVSVTTPRGTAILAGFTFVPAPTITSFTPYKSNSGTTVTITGTNFNAASSVTFGGTAAINYTVVSNTVITAVLGTGTSGNVAVTTPGGTATASGFVYGLPYASIDVLAGWNVTNTATQTYPFAASYKQASLVNTAVLNSTASASSSSDMQWTNSNSSAILDVASAPYISFALTTLADVKLDRFVIPGLNKTTSKIQLRWSVDNYASSLGEINSGNGTDLLSSIDLSSTVTQSAGTIQFRAYFYNGTNDLISMKSGNSFISIDGTANSYNSNYAVAFYGATKPSPTLGTIANISKVTTDPTFALPLPSSNSNGIVTYISSDPSIVSINGTMAVINGPGIATIIATQSASNNYSSGGTTFTITVKTTPTIYLPNYSVTVGDGTITLNAESNSSGAITYSSGTTSVATIIGNTLTIVGAGTSVITINQAASGNFTAATNTAIITVGAANLAYPTLSNFANINKMMSNPAFSLIAPTSNSAGTYTYYSSNASVATISGSTVTLIAPGISIITAIQAANGIYRSSSISAVLTVGIGANTNPVITNFTPISKYVTDIPFVITSPTSTSSAPFSYFSSLPNVGIINGSTTTIKGLGVSNITAIQPASGLYNAGSITNTLSVINAPPVINYNSPNILTKSAAINAIAPVLTGGVVSSYSIVPSLPVGLLFNTSTGVISGTPIVVSIPVTYTVTATNATGNGSTSFIIEVKDVAPSTLSYTTPNTYSVGTTISTLFPTNSGGTITNYTISPTLPGGLILNSTTGTISGTPSLALATTQFTITGTNTGGSVTTNITITVTDAAPTSLEYSTPNVLFKGVLINSLTPSYSGGAIVSYTISPSLPAGLTFNTSTGAITGRPSVPSASTNYTIIGTNSGGTVSKTISILVNDNEPTDLSYPTPNIFQVGAVITPLTPTIYGGVATRYSIDRPLPTGLNFNTTTGVISGTPTQITANTTYIVTAFNLMGRSNTTLDITIGGPASNLSYGGNLMLARNVIMTTVNPTINSNTSVTYSFSPALPAGLVFDTTTGQIFGMPTTSQSAQSYTVTANNGFVPNATVTFTIAVVDVPSISYVTPSNYTAGVAISNLIPTVSGLTPITFSIAPSLPSGMLFDTTTGVITGTPTSYTPTANYTITATNAVGSTPVTIPITVNKRIPTIGSLSIGNKTYGDANFDIVNPSTNSSGTFSYVSSNTAVATISGNTVSITGAGSATITANLASDADYDIGTTTATLTVNKAIPTIGSIASISKTFGDANFNLTAPTSNSSGSFSYASSDSNVVSIIGNTVTIVGAGTATITAAQAGDANYDPRSVTTTITVNKAVATLSAMTGVTKNFGDPNFNIVVPTSAGTGVITFVSSNSNVATISGNTVTIIGAGTATITAIQATDANYLGATTSTTLTVNKIAPTLGAMTTISKVFGDANFTITPPSTNSTGAFTYTSSDTNVATISGAVVSIVGAGTATISVDQAMDSNYLAAATSVSLAVNKAPVVFGTTTAITKNYGDADFILTPPQTNSTGTFTYSSNNPSIATINGNLVTIHGIGTTTITVNQATTTNYLSGSTTISLVVNKTLPTIGSIASITKTFGDAAFNLTAPTSNSTGAFSYASSDSNVVSIIGNTVTIVGAGTATITAAQAGDANYDPRSVTNTITVNKALPVLTVMTPITKVYGDASFGINLPTSSSTAGVILASSNTNVATISGNTISIIGVGTATITATQVANTNYLGTTTSTTLTVNKTTPVLSNFNAISKTTDDAPFTLIAPTSSGGTGLITYSSSNPSVATISGNMVTITGSGSTLITATKEGDTNYNVQSISAQLTVGVGSTQTPILVSPLTNTTGATTLQISYSLPESPLPGSVKLIFTPSSGGSSIIWNMNNTTFATFAYPVGTNPTLVSNVISGVALAFTTYNITISYQDVFASPVASSTNTNIQTLAPPRLSTSQINYSGIINNVITPIVITNSGGLIDSFTINPALPLGLVINPTTGVITGKPSVLLSTTNYTITATNAAGTGTINISLFIDGDMDKDDIGNLTDPDTDGDGVSNTQEVVDGTDPNNACSSKPSSITLPLSRSFLDGDCDSDGLTNEKEIGSNIKVPIDEDNNGIPDYLELNNHEVSEDDLEIFNSMTVNGDDLNDVFVIRGIEQYPNNTVIIYNRWGVEVYNVEGYGQDNKFFRGISEGRVTVSQSAELPKGTYFYILRYVNKQGVEKERSGYLYITK